MVLIHPDVVAEKLETELALLDYAQPRFWTPDLLALAGFWRRRLAVQLRVHPTASGATVELVSPEPLDGLTLNLGPRLKLAAAAAWSRARCPMGGRWCWSASKPEPAWSSI